MKIYVTGSVASGKSTLARRISEVTGIPFYHLDEIMYEADPTAPRGNQKRAVAEREAAFSAVLAEESYIVEDVGRGCFIEAMRQVDAVVLLDLPLRVRKKRILLRWIKQVSGIEKCGYKPTIGVLKKMFQWARSYDTETFAQFGSKIIVMRDSADIRRYLTPLSREKPY